MTVLTAARRLVSDRLWFETLKRHKSRMGVREAPRYSNHLKLCQRVFDASSQASEAVQTAARQFHEQGVATLWTPQSAELATSLMKELEDEQQSNPGCWDENGRYSAKDVYLRFRQLEELLKGDLGDLYRAIYQAHFAIYYALIYRSAHVESGPSGSQLWHADGGPGTCINTMMYLTDVGPEHGALRCLPWRESLEIFQGERRALRERPEEDRVARRAALAEYYDRSVDQRFANRVVQPTGKAGLIVLFRNNLIHKGGFPDPGVSRYVALFHAYPGRQPTPFERYRATGAPKLGPYPNDPGQV